MGKYALVLGVRYEKIAKERNGCAMKKAYQKPVLYAESYELAEHIASCGIQLNTGSIFICEVIGGDILESMGFFNGGSGSCSIPWPSHDSRKTLDNLIQNYCYTNGGCSGGMGLLHMS